MPLSFVLWVFWLSVSPVPPHSGHCPVLSQIPHSGPSPAFGDESG
jgi:hypothetical protein